jgi:hypothetical protein
MNVEIGNEAAQFPNFGTVSWLVQQAFSYCVEKTFDSGLHLALYLVQGSVLHPPINTRKYTCGAAT